MWVVPSLLWLFLLRFFLFFFGWIFSRIFSVFSTRSSRLFPPSCQKNITKKQRQTTNKQTNKQTPFGPPYFFARIYAYSHTICVPRSKPSSSIFPFFPFLCISLELRAHREKKLYNKKTTTKNNKIYTLRVLRSFVHRRKAKGLASLPEAVCVARTARGVRVLTPFPHVTTCFPRIIKHCFVFVLPFPPPLCCSLLPCLSFFCSPLRSLILLPLLLFSCRPFLSIVFCLDSSGRKDFLLEKACGNHQRAEALRTHSLPLPFIFF